MKEWERRLIKIRTVRALESSTVPPDQDKYMRAMGYHPLGGSSNQYTRRHGRKGMIFSVAVTWRGNGWVWSVVAGTHEEKGTAKTARDTIIAIGRAIRDKF